MNAAGDSTRHNRECCFQQNVTGSLNTNARRPPWVQQSFHLTRQQALRSESRAHTELIAADKHRTLIPRGHLSMFKVYNYVWKHDRLDLDQSSFTSLRIIREEEQEITNHIDRKIGGVCQARWENTKNSDTFFFFLSMNTCTRNVVASHRCSLIMTHSKGLFVIPDVQIWAWCWKFHVKIMLNSCRLILALN